MEKRKLSTILFADIAGYTALMQSDEKKALAFLTIFKETLEKETPQHSGKIIQYFGDGVLLSFDSTLHGVDCAIALQESFISEDIPIRIGMHLGDVVFRNDNVFGDGVNIASRIESMGVPGAILLSRTVRDQIKNKAEYHLTSLGPFDFKNVEEPLEVYALGNAGLVIPDRKNLQGKFKEADKSNNWKKYTAAFALIALLVVSAIWYQGNDTADKSENEVPKMAIMDFVNLGVAIDTNFATAISEEINNRLTGLKKLAVIARSSAMVYTGTNTNIADIGKELDVDYVLEGNVAWDKKDDVNSVEITPVLTRVSDNKKIWTGNFKKVFNESLTVHSDISEELLLNLDIVMSDQEMESLKARLTDNDLAYDAYLKGVKARPPGHGAEEDFRRAFKMFQQAVRLDPDFVAAWLGLGYVYKDLYWYGYESHPSTIDSAMACIERAIKIDPDNPQIQMELGDLYYRMRDYDNSLTALSKALENRPNDSNLLQRIAELWRRQGLFDEAIDYMEKGLKLDPFNVNIITELSWTYIFVGNFDRALQLQEQARKYNPDALWNHLMGALIHWCRGQEDDLKAGRALLENIPDPSSDYPAWFWVNQYKFENDHEAILRLIKSVSTDVFELQGSYEPVQLVAGLSHLALGNTDLASNELEAAQLSLEAEVKNNPTDFRLHSALGLAYAGLGQKEKAIASGLESVNILPLEKDSLLGLDVLYGLMRIYAILGEDELALDVMAKLLSVPCQIRGLFFTANPEFASLYNNVRFNDLVEMQNKMKAKFMN